MRQIQAAQLHLCEQSLSQNAAQTRVVGWALVAAGVPCFWIEWHWHGTLIVPTIVGINLVIAGLRMVYWGWGGSEKRRSSRE